MVTVSLHFPPTSHSNEEPRVLRHLLQTMSRMQGNQGHRTQSQQSMSSDRLHASPDLFFSEWSDEKDPRMGCSGCSLPWCRTCTSAGYIGAFSGLSHLSCNAMWGKPGAVESYGKPCPTIVKTQELVSWCSSSPRHDVSLRKHSTETTEAQDFWGWSTWKASTSSTQTMGSTIVNF